MRLQEVGVFQHKLSREASATACKELESKRRVNDLPPATPQKMRELPQPVAGEFAASHDPAVVKVYREELDKVHGAVH